MQFLKEFPKTKLRKEFSMELLFQQIQNWEEFPLEIVEEFPLEIVRTCERISDKTPAGTLQGSVAEILSASVGGIPEESAREILEYTTGEIQEETT